jgi:prolyl-tRNA editing enzyme YbaK/EbsC (Cys-tRNA(Pro) deacylase)
METNDRYDAKLKEYIEDHHIACEHLAFSQRCHSVAEAARAAGVTPQDFIKNICLMDSSGSLVVAIVKGEDRASTSRVARALKAESARIATPEEMLAKSGYPCGGTPSFGYPARFLIDEKVLQMEVVYSGGGSEYSLVKIRPADLVKANQGEVVRIRK